VFVLWRRLGSARQVVMELIAEGLLLPRRTVGQRRIRWARASYGAVHDLLTNPAYAGAFVFGRTRREKTIGPDGRLRVRDVAVPMGEWSVCPSTIPAMSAGASTSPRASGCGRT
jgi:Recombinase